MDRNNSIMPAGDSLRQFLWWMCERQRIWHRRRLEHQRPPWTEDPIFANYHFCNVHRELDAGTQYYLNEIATRDDSQGILFNTIMYRFFNRPQTMEIVGGYTDPDDWDPRYISRNLHVHHESESVFSPAYRVTTHHWAGTDNKIDNIVFGVLRDDVLRKLDYYTEIILDADTMKEAWSALKRIRGVGDFLAYELVTDLNYCVLPFSENDFVNIGPGAKDGLLEVFGEVREYDLHWLVKNFDECLDEYGLVYHYWEEKPALTLRDFEHAACEFSKYKRCMGNGGYVRKFEHNFEQDRLDDF